MKARDWFESIRVGVVEIKKLEEEIESIETQAGPHGQNVGSIGGGGSRDSMAGIDRMVDAGMKEKLARLRERYNPDIDSATDVLYGVDGRGGLAKARCTIDADMLCCYYLQGMGWAEIASGIKGIGGKRPDNWCRMRAMRALMYIDKVGMDVLAND